MIAKAIIKVNKTSAYSFLNGKTYEIDQILSKVVCMLVIDQNGEYKKIDFSHSEVFIVDIHKVLANAAGRKNNNEENILKYCSAHNIKL